ncbi:MAG: hypothetical protein IT215_06490 [Chitinophagaceae bacterium]|nr:hypothetical protein [Chitinophagaceae bacterium]
MINIDDYKKTEIKIGQIISAEKIQDTDKLLKLSVNFNEESPRQIVSGIALHYPDTSLLVGKKCAFVTNLEPRKIKDFESNGMILAASDETSFSLLFVDDSVAPGTKVK